MISLSVVIAICFLHWVADFVCQTDWMAQNKSKDNKPLLVHVGVYIAIFMPFAFVVFDGWIALAFIVFNYIAHVVTDYFTSRRSSRLHKEGKLGSSTIPNFGFFSTIGFDQFIHYVCLFGSYVILSTL